MQYQVCKSKVSVLPMATKRCLPTIRWWVVLGIMCLLVVACAGTSPTHGQWYPGGPLGINIQELRRVPEVQFQKSDDVHLAIQPEDGHELVILRLFVLNREADKLFMTIDDQSAELRGFNDDKYLPIDHAVRGKEINDGVDPRKRFQPFIWGQVELKKNYKVDGWMVFEVPVGTQLRQLKWITSGPVYIDLSQ